MNWHIYLDESGKFINSINEPSLIGGFIIECNESEKHTIFLDNCLKKIAKGQPGIVKERKYPDQFHSTDFGTDEDFKKYREWLFESDAANAAKRILFSKQSITPIMILWTQEDKTALKVKDEVYSEDHFDLRYRNMLRGLIRETIVSCPAGTILQFHIPTREAVVDADETSLFKQYAQNAMAENSFRINEPEAVRTMIFEVQAEVGRQDVRIGSLDIKTINYKVRDEKKREDLAGYYLADLICDYLKSIIKDGKWKRIQWDGLLEKIHRIFGKKPYAWIYGDAYKEYVTAGNAVSNGNLRGFLDCIVSFDNNRMLYCETYRQQMDSIMPILTDEQIESLDNEIYSEMYKTADYPKAHKYYESLAAWLKKCGSFNCPAAYRVMGKIMCCYHHEGNVMAAQNMFQTLKDSGDISSEGLVLLTNQHMGMYEDMFEFAIAESEIEDLISFVREDIQRAEERAKRLNYAKVDSSLIKTMGRVLSIHARMMAYQGKTDHLIDERFEEAISCFGLDSKNAAITLIHRLHYFIMHDQFDEFALLAEHVFGEEAGTDINELCVVDLTTSECWNRWLDRVLKYAKIDKNAKFQLYLYLKALYLFQQKEARAGKKIADLEKVLDHLFSEPNRQENEKTYEMQRDTDHPFELIYRYLALLSFVAGRVKDSNRYITKMTEIGNKMGSTIGIITRVGRIKIGLVTGWEAEALEEEKRSLIELIKKTSKEWKSENDSAIKSMMRWIDNKDYQSISEMLLYEYD